MLPKKKRITKAVFRVLMKEGKTFSTEFFLFRFIHNEFPHYAFVVPKNILKNAIGRNKYRRIGYNVLRSIPLKSGSGIFVFKKQAITATQLEIRNNILFILKKTGFFQ